MKRATSLLPSALTLGPVLLAAYAAMRAFGFVPIAAVRPARGLLLSRT